MTDTRSRSGSTNSTNAWESSTRTGRGSEEDPAFLQLLLDITTAANEASTLRSALPDVLDCVREHTGWPLGHAYLRDDDGALVALGLWSSDDADDFVTLRECTVQMRFAAGMGLPGRVLSTGRAEAIVDVTTDPGFLRTAVAVDLGVRAAFAFPIRTGPEILGVLEFFSRRSVRLSPSFLTVMEHVGTQLGRLIDRERAKQAADNAARSAREAERLQDEMVRMVSHDLRNPLNAIGLAAGLLHEVPLSTQQREHQVGLILRAVDHMRRLVEDLIDFERIKAGHGVKVTPTSIEPAELLTDACNLIQPQARKKGVQVVCKPAASLPSVHADFDRALQVLWNLTSNATKHSKVGARIVVAAEARPGFVEFSVSDAGPGIAPDDVEKLFDAYWQSKKAGRVGAGLGLPISKGIVDSHGGKIWVETVPGRGSTFRFTLPVASTQSSAH